MILGFSLISYNKSLVIHLAEALSFPALSTVFIVLNLKDSLVWHPDSSIPWTPVVGIFLHRRFDALDWICQRHREKKMPFRSGSTSVVPTKNPRAWESVSSLGESKEIACVWWFLVIIRSKPPSRCRSCIYTCRGWWGWR